MNTAIVNPREQYLTRGTDTVQARRAANAAWKLRNRTAEDALRRDKRFALLLTDYHPSQEAERQTLRAAFNKELRPLEEERVAIEREAYEIDKYAARIQADAKYVAVGLPVIVQAPAANLHPAQPDAGVDTLRAEYDGKNHQDVTLGANYLILTAKLTRLLEHADSLKVEQDAGAGDIAAIKATAGEIGNTSAALTRIANERAAIAKRLPAITAEVAERQRTAEAARRARVAKAIRPAIVSAVRAVMAAEAAVTYAKRLAHLTDARLPAFESLNADSSTPAFAQEWTQELIDSGWLQPSDVQVLQAEAR